MSREQLVQVAWEIHLALIPPNDLLASGERNAVAIIERLLAQEREKVREMCAVAVCPDCERDMERKRNEETGTLWHVHPDGIVSSSCRADRIRQLDLTKDLAASSREEGGK